MKLPIELPVSPMLAKAIPKVPAQDWVTGGLLYEPKWDGFRCIILRDGDEVELASRGLKPLTRYFPEVVRAVLAYLPPRCAIDAEIVVRAGEAGAQKLDWDSLSQRIHPAQSRITKLSQETPAELICFDLLALGDDDLTSRPFSQRRELLEQVMTTVAPAAPIHLTRVSTDADEAIRWFEQFEGAGLDGVVAKPLALPYQYGKRSMFKIKHSRTADAVLLGYRIHKSGQGVGSLLLGLYTDEGDLINVGGIVKHPGSCGGFDSTGRWFHASAEEVSAGVAGAVGAVGRGGDVGGCGVVDECGGEADRAEGRDCAGHFAELGETD